MAAVASSRAVIFGFAGALAAAAIIGLLSSVRVFEAVDLLVYDFLLDVRTEVRGYSPGRQQVVLILVDEATQDELQVQWPWPRSYHGRLVEQIQAGGARAIGFDMLFLDPSTEDEDTAFRQVLQRYRNIVLGAKLEANDTRSVVGSQGFVSQSVQMPVFDDVAHTALVNLPFDNDQVIRRFQPGFQLWGETYHSFAVAIYHQAHQRFPPLPMEEQVGIDFVGPGGTFRSLSAYQVLNGDAVRQNPNVFRNRLVLVGVTLSEAKEMFSTPVSKGNTPCPGVEVHANVLATLIDRSYITAMARQPQVVLAVFIALLAGYLAMFRSGRGIIIVYSLLTVCLLALPVPLMVYERLSLDITYPLLAIPLGYILAGLPARQPMVLQTTLGPYILLDELGRGGMAVVYKARHPRTKEVVALKKVLPEYAADEQALKRFLREMELLQQLNHPNIVQIIDAGEVSSQPYYAMEYISGQNMEEVLVEQVRLSPIEVRRTCEGVARALDQAHRLGVVHRDIKPSNIMLTGTGTPKLTDFGIACKNDAPHLTQAGVLIGTPQYMSPEQCQGIEVDPKADIYSFGATLYHLLTGSPPFPWPETARIVRSHLSDIPIDVRDKNPEVDEALGELVMSCLEKEPDDRPASMEEVAKVLDPYLAGTNVHLAKPSAESLADRPRTSGGTAQLPAPECNQDREDGQDQSP